MGQLSKIRNVFCPRSRSNYICRGMHVIIIRSDTCSTTDTPWYELVHTHLSELKSPHLTNTAPQALSEKYPRPLRQKKKAPSRQIPRRSSCQGNVRSLFQFIMDFFFPSNKSKTSLMGAQCSRKQGFYVMYITYCRTQGGGSNVFILPHTFNMYICTIINLKLRSELSFLWRSTIDFHLLLKKCWNQPRLVSSRLSA